MSFTFALVHFVSFPDEDHWHHHRSYEKSKHEKELFSPWIHLVSFYPLLSYINN